MKTASTLHHLALIALLGSGMAIAAPARTDSTKEPAPAVAEQPVKVVYHLNEGVEQAGNALRNIGNHLSADPTARIVVVAHAKGIDYLLPGAQDKGGNAFASRVADLSLKGVDFRVCNFTLQSRKIDPKDVLPEATVVPSGVAEVARLQAREAFVYVKP